MVISHAELGSMCNRTTVQQSLSAGRDSPILQKNGKEFDLWKRQEVIISQWNPTSEGNLWKLGEQKASAKLQCKQMSQAYIMIQW